MSEIKEITVTEMEEFDHVDVIELFVKKGDMVEHGQPLVTLESDKAMMEFPSPYAGVIEDIKVKVGDQVQEGAVLVTIKLPDADSADGVTSKKKQETNNEKSQSAYEEKPAKQETRVSEKGQDQDSEVGQPETEQAEKPGEDKSAETTKSTESAPSKQTDGEAGYASPSVQAYANDLGIDLQEITGSGRNQRVLKQDVQDYVKHTLQKSQSPETQKRIDFSQFGKIEKQELSKIQKLTARNMLAAWRNIPHVTHFEQVDVTLLEQHRMQLAEELKAREIKFTPLVFVIKALVATLKEFPQFNVSLDSTAEKIIVKKYFHIGIAVDTPHGLLVPVLRNVDKKTITQVAVELMEISDLARQRKLTAEQMAGASMTISSLGNLGGQAFTPIINSPEVAILGVSKMMIREKITATGVAQEKILPLSLSYDHRVINGADAARFCAYLKAVLEDIWKLIL